MGLRRAREYNRRMTKISRTLALSAAATLFAIGYSHAAGDFLETVAGHAQLLTPDGAADCQKEAEGKLAEPLAALKKRCEEAGGRFNLGTVNPAIHKRSCSVYLTAACSATPVTQEASADQAQPKPEAEAAAPVEKKKSSSPAKKTRRKPKAGERQVQTGTLAPKAK